MPCSLECLIRVPCLASEMPTDSSDSLPALRKQIITVSEDKNWEFVVKTPAYLVCSNHCPWQTAGRKELKHLGEKEDCVLKKAIFAWQGFWKIGFHKGKATEYVIMGKDAQFMLICNHHHQDPTQCGPQSKATQLHPLAFSFYPQNKSPSAFLLQREGWSWPAPVPATHAWNTCAILLDTGETHLARKVICMTHQNSLSRKLLVFLNVVLSLQRLSYSDVDLQGSKAKLVSQASR